MSLIERLFPGTTLDQFRSRYWMHELLIARGDLARFPEITENPVYRDIFSAALMDCGTRRIDQPAQDGENFVTHDFGAASSAAAEALERGKTIYFGGINEAPLPAFSDQLSAELDLPVFLEDVCMERFWLAFAARPSRGLRWHWDRHHLFVLQLCGTKKFQVAKNQFFARPTVPPMGYDSWVKGMNPMLRSALDGVALTDDDLPVEFEEIELRAGDAMFMPAGTWHRAETVEDSLHIAYAVKVPTLPDFLYQQLLLSPELFASKFHLPIASNEDFMRLCAGSAGPGSALQDAMRAWFLEAGEALKAYAGDDTYARFLQTAMRDVAQGAFSMESKARAGHE